MAFLDPFGLHLEFETIKALSHRRTDLIIYFPDRLDVLRNWQPYYFEDPSSNLDRFLGREADWRSLLSECAPQQRPQKLREIYVEQLRTLGYEFFEYERIDADGRPIYMLIFCSEHPLGGKIWRGIASHQPDKQRRFDFG